jgi:hypothetical protein
MAACRAGDPIGHVRHQRIVRDGRPGGSVTGHEDRDAVMLTFPVIDLLHEDLPSVHSESWA